MRNYLRIGHYTAAGFEEQGLVFFDDEDRIERAGAMKTARALATDPRDRIVAFAQIMGADDAIMVPVRCKGPRCSATQPSRYHARAASWDVANPASMAPEHACPRHS